VSILDLLSSFATTCLSTFEAPPKEDLTYKTYRMCSINKEKCMKTWWGVYHSLPTLLGN
jgi:hypothetical protein